MKKATKAMAGTSNNKTKGGMNSGASHSKKGGVALRERSGSKKVESSRVVRKGDSVNRKHADAGGKKKSRNTSITAGTTKKMESGKKAIGILNSTHRFFIGNGKKTKNKHQNEDNDSGRFRKMPRQKADNHDSFFDMRPYEYSERDYSNNYTTVKTRKIQASDGKYYYNPVDEKGIVPVEYIVTHFCQTGKRDESSRSQGRDLGRTAEDSIKLGKGKTPEEIVEWWADPSESDILGIDDEGSPIFDTSGSFKKTARPYQRKVAVIGDPFERRVVRAALDVSFTAEEVKCLTEKPCIYKFDDANNGVFKSDQLGEYDRWTDRIHIKSNKPGYLPKVVTIVHETLHRLRHMDKSRDGVYTSSRFGEIDDLKKRKGARADEVDNRHYVNHLLAAEEAATECETIARVSPYLLCDGRGSYYCQIDGDSKVIKRMRDEDRERLVGNADPSGDGLKGKRAISAVEREFTNTNISSLDGKSGIEAREYRRYKK